jgi:F0F1-type ATP synthase delta subunit
VALEATVQVPAAVIGRVDVRHLQRELEELENFLQQAQIRHEPGKVHLPRPSHLLEEFATLNKVNLLQPVDRQRTALILEKILADAPVVHISFSADPSTKFTSRIVAWLRANIHPQLLLDIGLQPTIAAGCIVRTPNHVFDFSLREHFNQRRELLTQALDAVGPAGPAGQSAPSTPEEPAS